MDSKTRSVVYQVTIERTYTVREVYQYPAKDKETAHALGSTGLVPFELRVEQPSMSRSSVEVINVEEIGPR